MCVIAKDDWRTVMASLKFPTISLNFPTISLTSKQNCVTGLHYREINSNWIDIIRCPEFAKKSEEFLMFSSLSGLGRSARQHISNYTASSGKAVDQISCVQSITQRQAKEQSLSSLHWCHTSRPIHSVIETACQTSTAQSNPPCQAV